MSFARSCNPSTSSLSFTFVYAPPMIAMSRLSMRIMTKKANSRNIETAARFV
jgi:hypothetical protein